MEPWRWAAGVLPLRYGVPESRRCVAGVAAWTCGGMDI